MNQEKLVVIVDTEWKPRINYLHTVNKKLRLVDKQHLGAAHAEIMEKVKKTLKIVLNLGN